MHRGPCAALDSKQQEQLISRVGGGVEGFRHHGGTAGNSGRDKLADRDRHIGKDRYVDDFLGLAFRHCSGRAQTGAAQY